MGRGGAKANIPGLKITKYLKDVDPDPSISLQLQLARDGDVQAMETLLQQVGSPQSPRVIAKINTLDENKVGILHYAARYEQLPMVELIVFWGADVNIRGDDGLTPLHFAARYSSSDDNFKNGKLFSYLFFWNRFKILRDQTTTTADYSLARYNSGNNVLNVGSSVAEETATLDIKDILGNMMLSYFFIRQPGLFAIKMTMTAQG